MSQLVTKLSDSTLTITGGKIYDSATLSDLTITGFKAWADTGPHYNITGTTFELLVGGTGYIKGNYITWEGSQTTTIVAGERNLIYINASGVLGDTATDIPSLWEDNIVLFAVLYDGTYSLAVKANQRYQFHTGVSRFLTQNIGGVIQSGSGGALAKSVTTQKVQIVGSATIEYRGLRTPIAATDPLTIWYAYLKPSDGNWYTYTSTSTAPAVYNNAGTVTGLSGTQRGVFRVFAVLDDDFTGTAVYIAVIHTAAFSNLSGANNAINNGTIAGPTEELAALGMAQLGYFIINNSGGSPLVEEVIVQKTTVSMQYSSSSVGGDHLLLANVNGGQYGLGSHTNVAQRYISASAAPTVNSDVDSFLKACVWIKEDTDSIYVCVDNTDGAAVWKTIACNSGTEILIGESSGASLSGSSYNTLVGFQAGNTLTSGSRNVIIGYDSDSTAATANAQVAIGDAASTGAAGALAIGDGASAVSANSVAVGTAAVANGTSAIAIGNSAASAATSATYLVAIGEQAAQNLTTHDTYTADYNIAIGYQALLGDATAGSQYTGDNSIAIGNSALSALKYISASTDGQGNIGCGYQAGNTLTSGTFNVCIGYQALTADTITPEAVAIGYTAKAGSRGVSIGSAAGASIDTSVDHETVCVGRYAGHDITSGVHNTCIGPYAGAKISTGVNNTFLGYDSGNGASAITGNYNVGIGYGTCRALTSASANIAIGGLYVSSSFRTALQDVTTGNYNIGIGVACGARISTAELNTFIGYYSGGYESGTTGLITGGYNVGIGYRTFQALETGYGNVAIGGHLDSTAISPLYNLTTGYYNVAVGVGCGMNVSTASQNTFLGQRVGGKSSGSAITGGFNTGVGYRAFQELTSGIGNVAVGGWYTGTDIEGALENVTNGTHNIGIGSGAGDNITTGDFCVCIGYHARAAADAQNSISIGTSVTAVSGQTHILMAGAASETNVSYNSTSKHIHYDTSSERFKTNIVDVTPQDTQFLYDIRIRKFDRVDGSFYGEIGPIAEELFQVYPKLVTLDEEERPLSYRSAMLSPMIIAELQHLHQTVLALTARVEALEGL